MLKTATETYLATPGLVGILTVPLSVVGRLQAPARFNRFPIVANVLDLPIFSAPAFALSQDACFLYHPPAMKTPSNQAAANPSLTVIIPCKDERANISHCIDSACLVGDEVIVADSGSTDGTLEYAAGRADCRVIQREYRTSGDFKNWAIPQARHAWVMILDADERVTAELAREIRELLASRPAHDGYWIFRSNHLMGHRVRHTDWARDKVLRLFRRDLGRYQGPSDHGEVVVRTGRVGRLQARLDHYTLWSWGAYLQKFDRYTRVQAEQWYEAGRPASWLRMFMQPPLRFLRDYVLFRGFLDGSVGLQISWTAAFYSYMKQARLWELHHGLRQSDLEGPSSERPVRAGADQAA